MISDPRAVAVLSSCLTASLLFLALGAEPPLVSVAEAAGAEDGMGVRTSGILASVRIYESGYEALLLTDTGSGEALWAFCAPGMAPMPSAWCSVGDEVLVEGHVARDTEGVRVFTSSDEVECLRKAEFVMDVAHLSVHWRLFEYDRFNITGRAVPGDAPGTWLLTDEAGTHSITLALDRTSTGFESGDRLTIDCTLYVDDRTMTVLLRAWSVTPHP